MNSILEYTVYAIKPLFLKRGKRELRKTSAIFYLRTVPLKYVTFRVLIDLQTVPFKYSAFIAYHPIKSTLERYACKKTLGTSH